MPFAPPPPLLVDSLRFSAKIDYAIFSNHGIRIRLPPLEGSYEWNRPKGSTKDNPKWQVTIQDPTPADLRTIAEAYENPTLLALEVAVDIAPKVAPCRPEDAALLDELYLAIAARFRPEERALWDYGVRGAVSGKGRKPKPLERRFPTPAEQVVYGHRGDPMQAKLYLKTTDQEVLLPLAEHRARMEVALKRLGCMSFDLNTASDLFNYPYRARFAGHFRIIDRPEVRAARELTEAELKRRNKGMLRAWATAGVGKFAVGDRPREDALIHAVAMVRARAKAQLPADHYKLLRHQQANAKIGSALVGLQRRMSKP